MFSLAVLSAGLLNGCGGGGGGGGDNGGDGGGNGGGGDGQEDAFPSERIELIVPWSAGGGTDQTARQLANAAEESCGTDIIVSNQTGSTGAVGFRAAADANADGYTIGVVMVEISMINHLGIADITPDAVKGVLQYNFDPAAISVSSDSEIKSLDDFVAAIKGDKPVRVSTSGTGSIWHISAAGMAKAAGGKITNVPFDGAAPAIQAVMGGQVEATTASGAEVASQVESGSLTPLATMGEEKIDILPDTPTLKESDIDWSAGAWRGLAVPSETPDEVVKTLNDCFKQAYDSDGFQEFMKQNGFGTVYKPAQEFETYMDEEFERFGNVIESLDIKPKQ